MLNRLDTFFGDVGMNPGDNPVQGGLRAFSARYRFQKRTWTITVWAKDWTDAEWYAQRHGLKIDGEIVGCYED